MPEVEKAPDRTEGALKVAIANAVVGLIREYTGRGATRARPTILGDLVTVLMEEPLTKAERSLVEDGKGEVVRPLRQELQETMRADLVSAVETLTERRVVAVMSDTHLDPDMTIEAFVLGPAEAVADRDSKDRD